MNVALWTVQFFLAAIFLVAGGSKLFLPIETLIDQGMGFVERNPPLLIRFIGLCEIAGAIGLFLPWATRIRPVLTPAAAAALTVVMVLAVGTHVQHDERVAVFPPLGLGLLAAFVAWGRFRDLRRGLPGDREPPLGRSG